MDYKDGDRVGRGGFAVVDAVDTDDYGLVAKKTLEPIQQILEEVGIDHLTKRFDREVRYQSELTHPNVVQILSFNLAAVPPYFYMPLAECSLKDELENGELSADEIRRALFDILNGLEHIHAQGYIHRDLKPGNVLKLQNQDKSYRYALSDFGLISATNSDTTTLTGSNAHGGSRNYSAPELLGGFGRATSAADIYSFGAILHDFFAPGMRRIPYAELSAPGDIGAVISKCTKTNTVRRYSAIAGLRDDLFNAIEGEQQEFATAREEELINLLEEDRELTDEEWDAVFIQMDDNKQAGDSNVNYFRAIGKARIEELQRDAPDLFN
ncbi:MAG: serine/threonine-protein kinase, partial [Marinoscillum sp.]